MIASFLTSWLLWGLGISWAFSGHNGLLFFLYGIEIFMALFMVTVVFPVVVVASLFVSLFKLARGDFSE